MINDEPCVTVCQYLLNISAFAGRTPFSWFCVDLSSPFEQHYLFSITYRIRWCQHSLSLLLSLSLSLFLSSFYWCQMFIRGFISKRDRVDWQRPTMIYCTYRKVYTLLWAMIINSSFSRHQPFDCVCSSFLWFFSFSFSYILFSFQLAIIFQ